MRINSLVSAGEPDAEWVADDLGLRWRPGRDPRGGHQCRTSDHGEGGQGLPEAGAGEPDGGLEVLHLLRLPGLPSVNAKRRGRETGRGTQRQGWFSRLRFLDLKEFFKMQSPR